MIKRYELFSFKSAKLLVLMFLLFGICAGCFEKDPVETQVNTLIQGLGDEDERVSSGSANELCTIGEPAVDPLIKALKDDNPQARSLAAQILGMIGDKKATNSLIEALRDSVPEVRMNAAFSLGELQATEAVEPLIELLEDENGEVVRYTVIALGMLKDPRATEPLCEVLKRDDASTSYDGDSDMRYTGNSNIRSEAVFALGETGDPRAVDTLLDLLADKKLGVLQLPVLAALKVNMCSRNLLNCWTAKILQLGPTP